MKAKLVDATGKSLEFRFNPKEYTVTKAATWNRPTNKGARTATLPEFGGAQPQTVQMELFFDDWEGDGDLSADIDTLLGWVMPTEKSRNSKHPQPQLLHLEGGNTTPLANYKCILKSVNAKYTMFKPNGKPVRATVTISLDEYPEDPPRTNPTSGSPLTRRVRVMCAGDSLHSVAYSEYDDPTLWRGLALFNGIDDPLRLPPGTRLLIPTADEAAVLSQ